MLVANESWVKYWIDLKHGNVIKSLTHVMSRMDLSLMIVIIRLQLSLRELDAAKAFDQQVWAQQIPNAFLG